MDRSAETRSFVFNIHAVENIGLDSYQVDIATTKMGYQIGSQNRIG